MDIVRPTFTQLSQVLARDPERAARILTRFMEEVDAAFKFLKAGALGDISTGDISAEDITCTTLTASNSVYATTALSTGGSLACSSDCNVGGNVNVTGDLGINGSSNLSGNATVGNTFHVGGTTTLDSSTTVGANGSPAIFAASDLVASCTDPTDPTGSTNCALMNHVASLHGAAGLELYSGGGSLIGSFAVNGSDAYLESSTGRVVVQQDVYTAPTFTGTWANFGASDEQAGYTKDAAGFVHLRGRIKSGTIGTSAFTLPAGYRPTLQAKYATTSNSLFGEITIASSGTVTPSVGNNASVSLDGISFLAGA